MEGMVKIRKTTLSAPQNLKRNENLSTSEKCKKCKENIRRCNMERHLKVCGKIILGRRKRHQDGICTKCEQEFTILRKHERICTGKKKKVKDKTGMQKMFRNDRSDSISTTCRSLWKKSKNKKEER